MIGCTTRPVSGAAIHRPGSESISAPRVWKMRLTLAFCSAKPNWMPRKPKHMFQICQNESCGLRALGFEAIGDPSLHVGVARSVLQRNACVVMQRGISAAFRGASRM